MNKINSNTKNDKKDEEVVNINVCADNNPNGNKLRLFNDQHRDITGESISDDQYSTFAQPCAAQANTTTILANHDSLLPLPPPQPSSSCQIISTLDPSNEIFATRRSTTTDVGISVCENKTLYTKTKSNSQYISATSMTLDDKLSPTCLRHTHHDILSRSNNNNVPRVLLNMQPLPSTIMRPSIRGHRSIHNTDTMTGDRSRRRHHHSHGDRQPDTRTRQLERSTIFLLIALGVATSLTSYFIIFANSRLGRIQVYLINADNRNEQQNYTGMGLLYFILSTCGFVTAAALFCKTFTLSATGSGLPELKSLLAIPTPQAADYQHFMSVRVLLTKIVGLICSVGSGLSVGTEGPLVHVAACIGNLLLHHVPLFRGILDSPILVKKIFAASGAVGISSAFNAPVGGLLFSVEATTTIYHLSNYWKSCVAAASGAAATYFLLTDEDPLVLLHMTSAPNTKYVKWELVVFFFMAVLCGYGSRLFLYFYQLMYTFLRPMNRRHPILLAALVAILTAILIYFSHSYTGTNVTILELTLDSLNDGKSAEMKTFNLHPIVGVLITLVVRCFLTILDNNILIPAGIFMPVFYIGSLFGRLVGNIVAYYVSSTNIGNYALVGAAAFSAGVTQTVSVTMIAVEMTGDIKLLLPLLVATIVSANISRVNGLSIYDLGILNRGLDCFEVLYTGDSSSKLASKMMTEKISSITKHTTVSALVKAMEGSKQAIFPVTDGSVSNTQQEEGLVDVLVGTLTRREVFVFLRVLFEEAQLVHLLRTVLPEDAKVHDDLLVAVALQESRRQRKQVMLEYVDQMKARAWSVLLRQQQGEGKAVPVSVDQQRTQTAAVDITHLEAAAGRGHEEKEDSSESSEDGSSSSDSNCDSDNPEEEHHQEQQPPPDVGDIPRPRSTTLQSIESALGVGMDHVWDFVSASARRILEGSETAAGGQERVGLESLLASVGDPRLRALLCRPVDLTSDLAVPDPLSLYINVQPQ